MNTFKKDKDEEILEFKFRDKTKEWGLNAFIKINKKGKKYEKIISAFDSSYYQLFLDSKIYRENCYECPYAQKDRVGDITIGDYWKIEQAHKEYIEDGRLNLKKGISCIIVNNERGQILLDKFGKNILKYSSTFEKVAANNLQLVKPSIMKSDRNKIMNIYITKGYKCVDKYYKNKSFIKRKIKKILYMLPIKIRNKIRKLYK